MIRSFRSKALKRFWQEQDVSGLRPDWIRRIRLVLSALDSASRPEDMNLPGLRFHALKGDLAGRYAVNVSGNWRLTFAWLGDDAVDLDLEDYHGR